MNTSLVFSKYHDVLKIDNKYYLFHTINLSTIKLNDESLIKVRKFNKTGDFNIFNKDEIDLLKSEDFLVDKYYDHNIFEKNVLSYLSGKFSNKNSIKIDIALTNYCNFICPYCYEKGYSKKGTKSRIKNDFLLKSIIEYIDKRKQNISDIEVVFHGGEPLLEKEFISKIVDELNDYTKLNSMKFHFAIITNGYYLDEDFIKKMEYQNLDYIQITIDGEKETHNKRRVTFIGENTFDNLINIINMCLTKGIKIQIRQNIDKLNANSQIKFLNNLYNYINPKYYGKKLFLDFGRIEGWEHSYSLVEYYDILPKFITKADSIGFKYNLTSCKITPFCSAETCNDNIIIDYEGNIYRCWNNVFQREQITDNIVTYDKNKIKNHDYINKCSLTSYFSKCLKCKYLQICEGMCPNIRKNIIDNKEENIYNNKCKRIQQKLIKLFIKLNV